MTAARIDVLCCPLPDVDDAQLAHYEKLLSEEEFARLRSFRSPSAAKEFLVGRALLRTALAERVNCDARQLQFTKNDDGKPSLVFPLSSWQFNLSHSHGWVALALCEDAVIGVDIESYRRSNNLAGIAKRFFTDAENAQLARCKESEWLDVFFAVWTLKEAHAKALGCGLPKILNCCSVGVDLTAGSIDFALSGAATTSSAIASWLLKLDHECALAVVAHGNVGEEIRVSHAIPAQLPRAMEYKVLARGR